MHLRYAHAHENGRYRYRDRGRNRNRRRSFHRSFDFDPDPDSDTDPDVLGFGAIFGTETGQSEDAEMWRRFLLSTSATAFRHIPLRNGGSIMLSRAYPRVARERSRTAVIISSWKYPASASGTPFGSRMNDQPLDVWFPAGFWPTVFATQ